LKLYHIEAPHGKLREVRLLLDSPVRCNFAMAFPFPASMVPFPAIIRRCQIAIVDKNRSFLLAPARNLGYTRIIQDLIGFIFDPPKEGAHHEYHSRRII
jgi:hypothetical protein